MTIHKLNTDLAKEPTFTVGVEEEYLLVNLDDRDLATERPVDYKFV